ncbi:unnamed protein product, partial [Allacma fusca]
SVRCKSSSLVNAVILLKPRYFNHLGIMAVHSI